MQPKPAIQYALSGDVHIAFSSYGQGEPVIITSAATVTMDGKWDLGFVQALSPHAQVIWYDKRGTGSSDGVASFTFEERTDDIRAIMDALGIEAAHLTGGSEGGPMSLLFAATYPDRVKSLTLYGSYPSLRRRPDYPHGWNLTLKEYDQFVDKVVANSLGDPEAVQWFWEMFSPSNAARPEFIEQAKSRPASTSPNAVRLIWENMYEVDVRSVLPTIRVPTTVVHRTGDRVAPIEGGRYLAEHIPGAKLIELPGDDHAPIDVNEYQKWLDAIRENIAIAEAREPIAVDRRLTTVLFTDIVNSTPAAAEAGDQAWTNLLDRHDETAQRSIADHHGQLVKTTGDGLLATFDGPSRAVHCAVALHQQLGQLGLPIRAGLHTGEIEIRGDDVAGIAVHIAARISGLAGAGETMVSSTVKDLSSGSGLAFDDMGDQNLKGVDQPWRCFQFAPD
jgi:class 3 adenylate cyclase